MASAEPPGGSSTSWPDFAGQAASAGVASFLSAPLAIDAEHTGSLNLYGFHVHADAVLLELFATAVEAFQLMVEQSQRKNTAPSSSSPRSSKHTIERHWCSYAGWRTVGA